MIKSKKAAMEMSVGTIVTIVLLMSVLVLGLILVRTIFKTSVENVEQIDQAVKNEITKLFSEDNTKKVIIYPASRHISIKQGQPGGFAIAIRNIKSEDEKFSYSVTAEETDCGMPLTRADDLLFKGNRNNIIVPAGQKMDDPIHVRFTIDETVPPCTIAYTILVEQGSGSAYAASIDFDLTILPE